MNNPKTDGEALALSLYLAMSAPDEAKAQKAVAIAERIASGMSNAAVDQAKDNALAMVEAMR